MKKKTILSIALVCVLLVSSGAVASGMLTSFMREKAPIQIQNEEQKILSMIFPPKLPLPPEIPIVMPIPEMPPIPTMPKMPPIAVEIPENPDVQWLSEQLQNVPVPEECDWFKENMTKCLDDCITKGPGNLDLTDPGNQTVFIQYVIDWWEEWKLGADIPEEYIVIITYLIKWLQEWLDSGEHDMNGLMAYMRILIPSAPGQPSEELPEELPEEPSEELPELPEIITVNMILDHLNNVTVPGIFEWLYTEVISCLDSYPEEKKDDNLMEEDNLTAFIDHVVGCLDDLELPEGFEQYQSLLDSLIECLNGWTGTPEELIDYLLACFEGWATTPVPDMFFPPEIPILPGF